MTALCSLISKLGEMMGIMCGLSGLIGTRNLEQCLTPGGSWEGSTGLPAAEVQRGLRGVLLRTSNRFPKCRCVCHESESFSFSTYSHSPEVTTVNGSVGHLPDLSLGIHNDPAHLVFSCENNESCGVLCTSPPHLECPRPTFVCERADTQLFQLCLQSSTHGQ